MVTYNRSLCDVEFSKYLKDIDVEVLEYVMMKIRENFETPTDKVKINFKDFTNFTNKHKNRNQSIKQSVERLDGITITTNIKSPKPSKRYKFNFKLFYRETKNGKIPKGFIVEFDEKIYKLFDKPTSYSKYNEEFIYSLPTKYSKLLYKFLVGYKFKKDEFYLYSDDLIKNLNINPKEYEYSYIQSQFIYKSIQTINENTDLEVKFDKYGFDYNENGKEIVKYIVSIVKYKGSDTVKGKSETQKRLDKWIENSKKNGEIEDDGKSPYTVVIRIDGLQHPYFLTDDYKLTQNHYDYTTETSDETLKQINQWVEDDVLSLDVENVYNEKLSKMSLIDKKELKKRGIIN